VSDPDPDPDPGPEAQTGEGAPAETRASRSNAGVYYTGEDVAGFLARRGLWEALRTELEADLEGGRAPDGLDPKHLSRAVSDAGTGGATDRGTRTGFDILYRHCRDEPAVREYLNGKLRGLTVCDPAAGGGSLLLAAARTLFSWRSRCVDRDPHALRREIVAGNVFGVDIRGGAVGTCRRRLREWALDAAADKATTGDGHDTGPEPDVSPNVRAGDSLLGFVDPAPVAGTLQDRGGAAPDGDSGRDGPRAWLDEEYAATQRGAGIPMPHHVDDADAAWRSLGLGADGRPPTLRVNVPEGLPDALAAYLESVGFTTYTYTARLDVPAPGGPDHDGLSLDRQDLAELFGRLRETGEDWEVVVERGYAGADFAPDRLDACHWPLEFPGVFREGEGGGFDLVIGNPPYGASVSPEAEPLLTSEANYGCQGASDTCEWFYERALDLAADDGVVSLVVTKAVAFYGSWSELRGKLLDGTAIRHVFDVGLGFADVNLETVALVHALGDPAVDESVATVYRSEDRRRADANRPVRVGRVDQRVMRDAGTIVFSPVPDDQREVLDRVLGCERRLEDVMSANDTARQLYIPDSEKRDLEPGTDAYIDRNPWVGPFHLREVWHRDLGDYRGAVEEYAVPRVMLKVLRGSRLRAWLDPRGELVGTEKLVNVPLVGRSPAEIAFVYAALNHPCASYYLQTAVFSGTTETARVLDGQYSKPVPLPDPEPAVESAVARLAWALTLARQVAHDAGREPGRECERLHDALNALVGGLYLDRRADRVRAWSGELLAEGPPGERVRELFESFYTARYTTRDGDPGRYHDEIGAVVDATAAVVGDWRTDLVCESRGMRVVEDAL
jgi:predicted RNA methylase